MRIRTDDDVIVIAGKDKGKTGKVIRVEPKKDRVYVEGLNMIKRHQRPTPGRPNQAVGVIEREGPIHVSNVAIVASCSRAASSILASCLASPTPMLSVILTSFGACMTESYWYLRTSASRISSL